jgi:DNA-binding winged helix-turn-helix (wHTH) protein/tetratricopeptide (TPR) repeat protein
MSSFRFEDFEADSRSGELRRRGRKIKLPGQSFQILILLLQHPGEVITREEIRREVWASDTFVDFEAGINSAVRRLRFALNDSVRKARFIETLPRYGYRFIATVSVAESSGFLAIPRMAQSTESTVNEDTSQFELTETVEKSFTEKSAFLKRLLGPVVLASVVIVIIAGLAIYSALNGVGPINGTVSPDRGTSNEEAYRAYLLGKNLSERRDQQNLLKAMEYLDQAIALDPKFARAWAAKALLYRYLATAPGADQTEEYKKSMDALGRAFSIDPNLSEAYSVLCFNKLRYEYDFNGAERACSRALELGPESALAHKMNCIFLYSRGRFEEAIAEGKRSIDLDPLASNNHLTYTLALYFARRYEEEEAQWKRMIELNPTHNSFIYTRLFINLAQQGKEDKAFDYLIKKLTLDKADNETIERFRAAYASAGSRGVTIERLKHPEAESFTGPFDVACLFANVGDKDKAFENLEKAFREHDYRIAVLTVEPQLDPLRNDPRYTELVKRVEGHSIGER